MRRSVEIGIVVVIAVVVVGIAVFFTSLRGPTLETKAKDFVGYLSEGKFDEAYELFNEEMVEAMSLEQLEAIWNDLIDQVGEYKDITGTRTATEMDYEVVYVTTQFEETSLDVKVVFDEESKITGLWFFPA